MSIYIGILRSLGKKLSEIKSLQDPEHIDELEFPDEVTFVGEPHENEHEMDIIFILHGYVSFAIRLS